MTPSPSTTGSTPAASAGTGPKFTPGPWTIGREDLAHHNAGRYAFMEDPGGYRIDAPGVEQICYVWNETRRFPADGGPQSDGPLFGSRSGIADARLIAAAPDLFAALAKLDAWWLADHPAGPEGDPKHGIGVLSDGTLALWREIRRALALAAEREARDAGRDGADDAAADGGA